MRVRKRKPHLSPRCLAGLRESGLSDATIKANGIYTEYDPERLRQLLRWSRPATSLGAGTVFPFHNLDGSRCAFARVRPHNPRWDGRRNRYIKYEQPRGQGNRAYFPVGSVEAIRTPGQFLVITEGEKKALAADQFGFPCIGLTGVFSWGVEGALIDDLAQIEWQGRDVYLVFDSDAAEKPDVQKAERRFATVLRRQGAAVHVVRLSRNQG